MNQIAICIGSLVLYWPAIVIALGVAVTFSFAYGLYAANGGKKQAMWAMFPIAVVLGVLISRLIHWYCHGEQYAGFFSAMLDYSTGGYVLPGVFMGVAIAVLIVKALGLTDSAGKMFDCLAPAACLGVAIIRMSALFNTSCRGKILVTTPALQRYPLASAITMANGNVEYRFAVFFAEFFVMLLLFVLVMHWFNKRRSWPMKGETPVQGNVGLLFLAVYGASQVILDSMRYDSSFLPINGFISLVMILGTVAVVGVMAYYTVMSVKVNGVKVKQIVLWVVFLACGGVGGYMEYLVQRYGNMYLPVYTCMASILVIMCICMRVMYGTVCLTKEEKRQKETLEQMNKGLKETATV